MGWELAAMVQSPVIVQSGFTTFTIKMMMIFQRKLIPSFQCLRRMKAVEVADGQPGTSFASSKPTTAKGGVFTAKGANEESTGYYHEVLKKYIYSTDDARSERPVLLRTHNIGGYNGQLRSNVPPPRSESYAHLNGILPQSTGHSQSTIQRRHSVDSDAMLPSYTEAIRLSSIPVT